MNSPNRSDNTTCNPGEGSHLVSGGGGDGGATVGTLHLDPEFPEHVRVHVNGLCYHDSAPRWKEIMQYWKTYT